MCPVCFTGADPEMRDTLNAGIGVLMGITAIVLALFARFFVKLARRSRAAAHLVDHTTVRGSSGNGNREGREEREDFQITSRTSPSSRSSHSSRSTRSGNERRIA